MNNTTNQVAAIGKRLAASGLVGFDPTLIITALLPILAACFAKESNESPKEYLEAHYDDDTGTFDPSLINRCRPQTRRAARADGQRRLSRPQLDLITVETLEQARTAKEEDAEAVLIELGVR